MNWIHILCLTVILTPTFTHNYRQRNLRHNYASYAFDNQESIAGLYPSQSQETYDQVPVTNPERPKMNERSIVSNSRIQKVQDHEVRRLNDSIDSRGLNEEHGSFKILNRKTYPTISDRKGVISEETQSNFKFPGPTATPRRFIPEVPEQCKGKTICEFATNYPHDYMEDIIKVLPDDRQRIDIIPEPNIAQRIGSPDEDQLCRSNTTLLIPRVIKDRNTGDWRFVVNSQRGDRVFQKIRVELCQNEGSPCNDLYVSPALNYNLICEQHHIVRFVEAIDEQGRKTEIPGLIPSCCTCKAIRID